MRNLTTATTTRTAGMTRKGESCALSYANVAQLGERLFRKQRVAGSMPAVSSKKNMNTLNIRSITTASAVRAGSRLVLPTDSSARSERATDNRKATSSNLVPSTTEPLRERWRAPTHAHGARTGCRLGSKPDREAFESLASCYTSCTGIFSCCR